MNAFSASFWPGKVFRIWIMFLTNLFTANSQKMLDTKRPADPVLHVNRSSLTRESIKPSWGEWRKRDAAEHLFLPHQKFDDKLEGNRGHAVSDFNRSFSFSFTRFPLLFLLIQAAKRHPMSFFNIAFSQQKGIQRAHHHWIDLIYWQVLWNFFLRVFTVKRKLQHNGEALDASSSLLRWIPRADNCQEWFCPQKNARPSLFFVSILNFFFG
jgi:hypothetical protein